MRKTLAKDDPVFGAQSIAPVIREPFLDEMIVIHEGMYRQKLNGRYTNRAQMSYDRRLCQTSKGPSKLLAKVRMQLRVSPHVQLVDDSALP